MIVDPALLPTLIKSEPQLSPKRTQLRFSLLVLVPLLATASDSVPPIRVELSLVLLPLAKAGYLNDVTVFRPLLLRRPPCPENFVHPLV